MMVCAAGKLEPVKVLRKHGARYDLFDNGGCAPIHWAVDGNNVKLIEWMAEDGADLNLTDKGHGRWTPLIRCANLHGNRDLALALMMCGADIHSTDCSGSTALHHAVMRKHFELTQLLLQRRADPLLQNKEDHSAYLIAMSSDDRRRIAALMEPYVEKAKNQQKSERRARDLQNAAGQSETPMVDFSNKLYLAPLTTVGNLPFRRLCKKYGADITCGEMAMASNLLQGQQSEWALLKRHHTEDIFGVQICGAFPDMMTRCGQLLQEQTEIDFIDINSGCPIDLIYKRGEGCALMGKITKYENIVRCMNSVIDVPLTVKMRTGIMDGKNTAHTLIPRLRDAGAALVTLHGRSREQRYTRLADWDYIKQCAEVASPMPVFGNGDILSFEDYNLHKEASGVSGIMIARGALIKPWIFTEIKEQRHWDISANERFDMLRDYCNFGLEYWGSDTKGVENTRRFLLEWLSFLYRYIPVGVLERPPQKINERPPHYHGRNDLETLMASPSCGDWVKIRNKKTYT
nr:hypothetical protein BaRGS_013560 [Batillaria attramentaria]